MASIKAAERLIVALDFPEIALARELVDTLGDLVSFYKVGLQLRHIAGVEEFIGHLRETEKRIFLDMKVYDIPQTIEGAVSSILNMGATFLTVHGPASSWRAAVEARGVSDLKILAVTVLTSIGPQELQEEYGSSLSVEELVLKRAQLAISAGCDGVIASAMEAPALRALAGSGLLIVTPGIRPRGTSPGDQKRPMEPGAAVRAGADYLVVGRPIIQSADPRGAAQAILDEMQEAFDSRI